MHTFGVFHEKVQQLELGGAHLERLPLEGHAVGAGVEHQLANGHAVADLLGSTTAQHGTDPRQQLLRGERLGDVVVGTRIEPSDLVGFIAPGRQHQDRDRLGAAVRTPLACQRQAALPRQHPVEQDDIRQHGIQLALGRVTVFRPKGLESVVA